MGSSWALVYILWGIIAAVVIGLWIYEERKTPEQRQKERDKQARLHEQYLEEERLKKQQTIKQPARGCLEGVIRSWLLLMGIFVLVIVCIMLLISTTF